MKPLDDFSFYLDPIDEEVAELSVKQRGNAPFKPIDIHTAGGLPDIEEADLVIVGIDERSGDRSDVCAPDEIRKKLYHLHLPESGLRIADLGNIKKGATPKDTQVALQYVISGLALHRTMAVVIGGRQDLTFAIYAAYEILESTVNLAIADAKVDMGEFREELSEENYLSKIVIHKPSYLFNLSVLGYQNYLNDPETLLLMDKLYFDSVRLGEIKNDPRSMEPHLRQADILSIDSGSIKNADGPGSFQPNGFTGEEICRLARYAGLGDKCSTLGIFNYIPEDDPTRQTALLIAQIVWHAAEGLSNRIKEYPLMNKPDFLEYKVQMPEGSEHITFFKSKRTDKWWMNVPYAAGDTGRPVRHHLIPCNYTDYELAASGDIPDLWWRTYRKLT